MASSNATLTPGDTSQPAMASSPVSGADDTHADINIYLAATPNIPSGTFAQQQEASQHAQVDPFITREDGGTYFHHDMPAKPPSSIYSPDMGKWSRLNSPSQIPSTVDDDGPPQRPQPFSPAAQAPAGQSVTFFPPTPQFRNSAEAHADSYKRLFGESAPAPSPDFQNHEFQLPVLPRHTGSPIPDQDPVPGYQFPSLNRDTTSSGFQQFIPSLHQFEVPSPISPNFAPSLPQGPFQQPSRQSASQLPTSPTTLATLTSPHNPIPTTPFPTQNYTTPRNSQNTGTYLHGAKDYLLHRYLQEFPGGATRVGESMVKRQIRDDVDFFIGERGRSGLAGVPFTDEEMIRCCELALAYAAQRHAVEDLRMLEMAAEGN